MIHGLSGMFQTMRKFGNVGMLSRCSKKYVQQSMVCKFSDDVGLKRPHVGVVLSGCGVYDGSEVTETVSASIHFSANGIDVTFFAPNRPQMHVINHATGEVDESSTRNIMEESARLTRGSIKDLKQLNVAELDGLFFPGGFGVAKNLSNYAVAGEDMAVAEDVLQVIKLARKIKLPMSFVCIAPVLASKVFGPHIKVTVGGDKDDKGRWPFYKTATDIKKWGSDYTPTDLTDICVDSDNLVTTGCAYMDGKAKPHQIFDHIGNVIDVFSRHVRDGQKDRRAEDQV